MLPSYPTLVPLSLKPGPYHAVSQVYGKKDDLTASNPSRHVATRKRDLESYLTYEKKPEL
jgi:hypothetical protein